MGNAAATPRVDVVILTWNDGELLDAAVDSALKSSDVDVRVIVVDNGSDLAPDLPAGLGDRVTLLANRANRGVAAGRNQGAAVTTAPYVCFVDSDARLLPDTLARLVEPLTADPSLALAAPVFTHQAPEASAGQAPTVADKVMRLLNLRSTYRPVSHGPAGVAAEAWDVEFAIGACQMVRRDAFMAAGGFDEDYFYGPEDVDFCLRLRGAGQRVVQVASAGCHHPARRRFRGIATRRGMQHGWAVVRHLWRHRRHQVAT